MQQPQLTARLTGAAYLALGIVGMLGFLVIRPRLFDEDSAAATFANLADNPGLAHLGIALELGIVITQALAAVGFWAVFRSIRPVAAFAIAVFGMANSAAILASATFLATASGIVAQPSLGGAEPEATTQLLFTLSQNSWDAGAVFFGLWLIPMGLAALAARMPRALGWILIVGGVGYVASALLGLGMPDAPSALVDSLTLPATVGEFWMIGYLLIIGIRSTTASREATS